MQATLKLLVVVDGELSLDVVALELRPESESDHEFLKRHDYLAPYVSMVEARSRRAARSPADWDDQSPRTLGVAHLWIADHFAELQDGQVVDVEWILGEVKFPRTRDKREESGGGNVN